MPVFLQVVSTVGESSAGPPPVHVSGGSWAQGEGILIEATWPLTPKLLSL